MVDDVFKIEFGSDKNQVDIESRTGSRFDGNQWGLQSIKMQHAFTVRCRLATIFWSNNLDQEIYKHLVCEAGLL